MASQVRPAPTEESCQSCGAELTPRVAYCPECGQRTRYASRMVRFWARIEVIFVLLVALLVIGFAFTFYFQR